MGKVIVSYYGGMMERSWITYLICIFALIPLVLYIANIVTSGVLEGVIKFYDAFFTAGWYTIIISYNRFVNDDGRDEPDFKKSFCEGKSLNW